MTDFKNEIFVSEMSLAEFEAAGCEPQNETYVHSYDQQRAYEESKTTELPYWERQ